MSETRTQLEHLSVELFRLIFEYLAPHELLQSFDNLNNRFTAILARQPLCLPNNRQMPYELYQNYISKISDYASQLVYLHLSERYAPHAVDELLAEVDGESLTLPALKAAIIQDLPPDTFINLRVESSLLTQVRSLTVEMSNDCYHYSEYVSSIDMDYLLPVLNHLPNLCSLSVRISPWFDDRYIDELKSFVPLIKTHHQLHTLSIDACSRQLFAELLGGGHLPKLRRLDVVFSRAEFFSFKTKCASTIPSSPAVPFEQSCIPELRCVSVYLRDDIAGLFTYFENIRGQLEKLKISGYVDMSENGNLPRFTDLRQWLTGSTSDKFTFAMDLNFTSEDDQRLKRLVTEYWRATGGPRRKFYSKVNVRYSTMSRVPKIEWNDDDSSSDESEDEGEDVTQTMNSRLTELNIFQPDCLDDEWLEEMKSISSWPCLRKISLSGHRDTIDVAISLLLHIAQRAPRFRQLNILGVDPCLSGHDYNNTVEFHFGHLLKNNRQLGMILASQLEVLHFEGEHLDCSLLDLARTFDRLFSHSTSPPVLKSLTFDVGAHPRSWLNTRRLMRGTKLLFNRFPSLIHFTLNGYPRDAYTGTIYDFSTLAPEWYVHWTMSQRRQDRFRSLSYRYRPNSLDVWL